MGIFLCNAVIYLIAVWFFKKILKKLVEFLLPNNLQEAYQPFWRFFEPILLLITFYFWLIYRLTTFISLALQ
ncbi:hypothetical protein C1N54_26755 (plasmid) [Priestia megaterium]|nr:hypothetical protein C1N54_26755 [Priestia megaterium]